MGTTSTSASAPSSSVPSGGSLLPGEFILTEKGAVHTQYGVLLVTDVSLSMRETNQFTGIRKIDDVSDALTDPVVGFVPLLQRSSMRDAFSIGVLPFAGSPRPFRAWCTLAEVKPEAFRVAESDLGSSTAIGSALKAARELALEWKSEASGTPREVTVLLMSDGGENAGTNPMEEATALKAAGITLVVAGYGGGLDDADGRTLAEMASPDPDGTGPMYAETRDGQTLRQFFARSTLQIVRN